MTFIKGVASLGAAMLIGLSAPPARAGYVVDLTQQGSDVVATGSGPIDLTGLSFFESRQEAAGLLPAINFVDTGPVNTGVVHVYLGITGPSNFGSEASPLLIAAAETVSALATTARYFSCH